jgi:glycosyltransferase involved in cell wall biosynthesis
MKNLHIENRFKIGIIFNFSPSWMGGIVYIINLIKTLDFLDDEDKPEIFLFYSKDLNGFLGDFTYSHLNLIEWQFPSIIKGNIISLIHRKNFFIDEILSNYSLDTIYPLHNFPVRTKTNVKLVSWWADLQHKHYPDFFTKAQILGRNIRLRLIFRNSNDLVVSSQQVLEDFKRFYKLRKDFRILVFHFVSVIDNLDYIGIHDLKKKYNLPDKYFIVSNQFHKHKNHKVLLLSLAKLKEMGIIKHLVMTGKFPNAADSKYLAELHRIVEENKLKNQISPLGIISRNEQLQLMRHSQAVLQPSLFEGWSTVIEDAKSLQVPVVASDLNVNIEQLGKEGYYFDPHNPDKLALILAHFPERNLSDVFYEDYDNRIKKAAKELLTILR